VDGDENGMYELHGSLSLQATSLAKYFEMGFCFTLNKDSEKYDSEKYVSGQEKFDCYANKFS